MSLADQVLKHYNAAIASLELVPSGGGVFEVSVDGELAFSKKESGRFPEWEEIRGALD